MKAVLLAIVITLAGCLTPSPPRPCPPIVTEDQPDDASSDDVCGRAGATLQRLGCPEALPDYRAFCRHRISRRLPYRPACIAKLTKCADVEKCNPEAVGT
jgi:hypothetical protein